MKQIKVNALIIKIESLNLKRKPYSEIIVIE